MNHNAGPIAKIVVASTLTFGAIGATVGGVIDRMASEGIHMPDREYDQQGRWIGTTTLNSRGQELLDANANLEETRGDVESVVSGLLDEKCRSAVRPYRLGGEFADVPEEGVVSDLMAEPNLPCQSWRKQIRAIIRSVRNQDARVQQELNNVGLASEKLEEYKGYREDDRDFSGALRGGALFGVVGLFEGILIARRRKLVGSPGEVQVGAVKVEDAKLKP